MSAIPKVAPSSTATRPICVHCHKPYGQRDTTSETVCWAEGEEMPPYRGNGIVMKTSTPNHTISRAVVRGLTMMSANPKIRERQEKDLAEISEQSSWFAYREIWDGESFVGGYHPFCTLRCALDYARRAYADRNKPRR